MIRRKFLALVLLASLNALGFSKTADCQTPESSDGFSFDSYLRYRLELVDWYHVQSASLNSDYVYNQLKLQLGAKYKRGGFRSYVQGQYFQLLDLPFNGVGPGSVYYATNDMERNPGDFILRQLYVAYGNKLESAAYDFTVGRMLYANGLETANPDKTVEGIKKQRIANRVIGPFDFTAGRSFDSLRTKLEFGKLGVLAAGFMRPTQGGFSTEGSVEIQDIDLATVSWNLPQDSLPERTDAQIFWYYYGDDRLATVKTDNRSLDIRTADTENISIHNAGGHWVAVFGDEKQLSQFLFWGILQAGDWGRQDILSGALAIEAGSQFLEYWGKPIVRLGYNWGSGDKDPTDDEHHTFMQMLPTARQYAYTPFYNLMNNQDLFVSAAIQPAETINVLASLHYLQLSETKDLLYAGGGANLDEKQFGYSGTLLSGATLGILPEISISWDMNKQLNLSLYYGHLFPSDSFEKSTANSNINYAFLELVAKY